MLYFILQDLNPLYILSVILIPYSLDSLLNEIRYLLPHASAFTVFFHLFLHFLQNIHILDPNSIYTSNFRFSFAQIHNNSPHRFPRFAIHILLHLIAKPNFPFFRAPVPNGQGYGRFDEVAMVAIERAEYYWINVFERVKRLL